MLKTIVTGQTPAPGRPFVMTVVGDSLLSGMQDMHVDHDKQEVSVPKLLADQVGINGQMPALKDGYKLPVLFPTSWNTAFHSLRAFFTMGGATSLPLAWANMVGRPPEWSLKPLEHAVLAENRPDRAPASTNFAIPGAKARDLLMGSVSEYFGQLHEGVGSMMFAPTVGTLMEGILGTKGSAVDQAVSTNPDLILLWAGNNDAVQACFGGTLDDANLTPMEDGKFHYGNNKVTDHVQPGFKTTMSTIIDKLEQGTHADICMMNIPDVTNVAFLRKVGEKVGPLPVRITLPNGRDVTSQVETVIPDGIKGEGKDGRTKFPAGTKIGLFTLMEKVPQMLLHGPDHPIFTENQVLDPDELQQIRTRVDEFNHFLADRAAHDDRVHLVDIHGLLDQMHREGRPLVGAGPDIKITDIWAGTQDERGFEGIFSYDGQHPATVGQAVMANVLLQTIQRELGQKEGYEPFRLAQPIDEKSLFLGDPRIHESPHSFANPAKD